MNTYCDVEPRISSLISLDSPGTGLIYTSNAGLCLSPQSGLIIISKSFMTLHTSISKQRSLQRPSRVRRRAPRASQACEGCAIAKVRCDNNKICLRCRRRQVPCIRPWPLEGEESQSVRNGDGLQPEGMAHLRPDDANPAPSQAPEADMQPSLPTLTSSGRARILLFDVLSNF